MSMRSSAGGRVRASPVPIGGLLEGARARDPDGHAVAANSTVTAMSAAVGSAPAAGSSKRKAASMSRCDQVLGKRTSSCSFSASGPPRLTLRGSPLLAPRRRTTASPDGSSTRRVVWGATGSAPSGTQRLARHSSLSGHALGDRQGTGADAQPKLAPSESAKTARTRTVCDFGRSAVQRLRERSMAMEKITAAAIRARKGAEKIAALTAYDVTFARVFDAAEVDVLLVGDTLGMVIQGASNTLAVTVEDVIYHTRAVARGASRALIVADMPFMSYQVSPEQALASAGRLVKEGGAEAVKLEGGQSVCPSVQRMVEAGIPVMGHLGLTPQSVHTLGGFRVQAKDEAARERLLADARALEQAGVFALVLEAVPRSVAKWVTENVSMPTIGIGAGPDCDGQVLVCYDFLGLFQGFVPRFVKRYAELGETVATATRAYVSEVRAGQFPEDRHSFGKAAPDEPGRADEARYASGPKARE